MKQLLKKWLTGNLPVKEYATVSADELITESVSLHINSTAVDVSENQFLLCLDPIVFGIWIKKDILIDSFNNNDQYQLRFKASSSTQKKKTLATLTLDLIDRIDDSDGVLILLKLKQSKIFHIGLWRANLLYQKFYKKPNLSFPKLKGFVAAYSYPRRVRVISFKEGDYFNIFPMDLLGDITTDGRYVFGLRHTNTALARIIKTGKIVVSEADHSHKDVIYRLGSHHSSGPPDVQNLPFKILNSEHYGFFVPEWVESYKEISIIKTINLGSHMLLWGKVEHTCRLKAPAGHLYHIHHLLYLYQQKRGACYPLV